MAEDPGGAGGRSGGGLFQGPPVAGIPRPVAVGGGILLVVGGGVYLWKRHQAKAGSATAVTTVAAPGSSSSSVALSDAALQKLLQDWQSSATSSSTAAGSGGGSGGGSDGSSGAGSTGSGTGSTAPSGPTASTTTDESGQMHGITLAQAQYLFDTGNQPYVFDQATNSYVRWSGLPVAGQTFYAGPLNWQDALKNGTIIGGTKGHPQYKSAAHKQPPKTTVHHGKKPTRK